MDPTKEETYTFLTGLLGEMSELFQDDLFHIGGDEVQSLERCRNEAYRWELKLASEVLASTLGSWMAKPRINRRLLHK